MKNNKYLKYSIVIGPILLALWMFSIQSDIAIGKPTMLGSANFNYNRVQIEKTELYVPQSLYKSLKDKKYAFVYKYCFFIPQFKIVQRIIPASN